MAALHEDVWIWRNGDAVVWLSPSACDRLDSSGPGPLDLGNLEDLRAGFGQAEICTALGRDGRLAQVVCKALDERRRVRLRLLRTLRDDRPGHDWTWLPFEWMRVGGAPLHGRVAVERFVPPEAVDPLVLPALRDVTVFMRLEPQEELEFLQAFRPAGCLPEVDDIEVLHESQSAYEFGDPRLDLERLSALVLICHGTEAEGPQPFRLPDGSAWALPHNRGMPPLVLLLVCGSDAGNLLRYARDELFPTSRIQTVIAPVGKLALNCAGQFLRRFLEEWTSGRAVHEIVRDAQAAVSGASDGLDARRLCVLGRGDLRLRIGAGRGVPLEWTDMADDELAARVHTGADDDAAALVTLVNRSTVKCLLEGSGSMTYEEELWRRLGRPARRSLAELLARCLKDTDARLAGPVPLWKLSEGWVRLALGQRSVLLERRAEFDRERDYFMPFPAQGEPGREAPRFQAQDLPTPMALAWERVNAALDRQQLPLALKELKEAFQIALGFIASVAAMDRLRAAEMEPEREPLVRLLFEAQAALAPGAWLDCLRMALKDSGATRLVAGLRRVAFTKRAPSKLMHRLTDDYVAWQQSATYDMRQRPAELVGELLSWLQRLREMLEEASSAWSGWTFASSHNGTRWMGTSPRAWAIGPEVPLQSETASLVMVHADGRSLDLAPLLTVQHCDQCSREQVFFYTQRRAGTAGAGVEFCDHPHGHGLYRSHVPSLATLSPGLAAPLSAGRGDEAARAEEERLAFRDFPSAEQTDYLADRLRDACDDLENAHGAGYVHMVGPEGFGKSWFAHGFAKGSRKRPRKPVLLCRVGALGQNAGVELLDHLCAQASDHGLKQVPQARRRASEQSGPSDQFVALLQSLVESNDLVRLTVMFDGIDELPEPPVSPARDDAAAAAETLDSLDDDGADATQVSRLAAQSAGDAAAESEEQFLLNFLPTADRMPERVFVVLISREVLGGRVTDRLDLIKRAGAWIEMPLRPDAPDNIAVVRAYVARHVRRRPLVDLIMQRSGGVFLWASHLVQAIRQGMFAEQDDLPQGEAFYAAYLDRLRRREGEELFESVYLKLLMLLAAAQEPVSDALLGQWGLGEAPLRTAAVLLRDLLSIQRSPRRYSIKHEGLRRHFAMDSRMAAQLRRTRQGIVNAIFQRYAGRWGEIDIETHDGRYVIRSLPALVRAAGEGSLKAIDFSEVSRLLETLAWKAHKNRSKSPIAGPTEVDDSRIRGRKADRQSIFADALLAWGEVLTDQSFHGEAALALNEAVTLRRELRAEGNGDQRAALAACLHIQSRALNGLGVERRNDLLGAIAEAVALRRELVAEGRKEARADLLSSLQYHAFVLSRFKRHEAVVDAYGEVIAVQRQVMAEGGSGFWIRWRLADAIHVRGGALVSNKRLAEAVVAYTEAADLRRQLVSEGWKTSRRPLALSLDRKGYALSELHREREAAVELAEAIQLRRQIAAEGADLVPHLSALGEATGHSRDGMDQYVKLSTSLRLHGYVMDALGRLDKAVASYGEAIELERKLVAGGRTESRDSLGWVLNNYGESLRKLGRMEAALDALDESISLRRALHAEGKKDVLYGLQNGIGNKGRSLAILGRYDEALCAYEEALSLNRSLADGGPDGTMDDRVELLLHRGNVLYELGRTAEGMASIREALDLAMSCTATGVPLKDKLPEVLIDYGEAQLKDRDAAAACASYRQAIDALEQTASSRPWAAKKELLRALSGLARASEVLGQAEASVSARGRATQVANQMLDSG